MFNTSEVKVGSTSKYQPAGVSERVGVTEVLLIKNEQFNTSSLQFKTINENNQAGLSKRLSLKQDVSPGKTVAAWVVSAKYLLTMLMSVGYTRSEADEVLNANDENQLVKNLENALIGKQFRALFSSREYQSGKFAIELYKTEPVGGTTLGYDPTNKDHNSKLDILETTTDAKVGVGSKNDL